MSLAIPYSAIDAILAEQERAFQVLLPGCFEQANKRRKRKSLPALTLDQATRILRCVSGGNPVATLIRVEVAKDGSLTI